MKKIVYYWSPCLTKVGTVKSTLNSAIALSKYNANFDVRIINVFGEWTEYSKILRENSIKLVNLFFDYKKFLPKYGFFKSRFSYLLIIFFSFIPLIKLLKKEKPDYLIAHLITSLPLILFNIFSFKTKLILRISGYPKLNFLRKKIWTKSENFFFKVTCPTHELLNYLIDKKIFLEKNIVLLTDAILNIKDFLHKKEQNIKKQIPSNYFLSIGRFTKQKNFEYLIDEFKEFTHYYPNEKLLIIGEGELKSKLERKILNEKLSSKILLMKPTHNVHYFMKNAKAFIMPSLWEEVGFVMVEASISNTFVISSDCKNGPKEFLSHGKAGLLFENNRKKALKNALISFMNYNKKEILEKKILAKKNSANFSMFRHQVHLKKILN